MILFGAFEYFIFSMNQNHSRHFNIENCHLIPDYFASAPFVFNWQFYIYTTINLVHIIPNGRINTNFALQISSNQWILWNFHHIRPFMPKNDTNHSHKSAFDRHTYTHIFGLIAIFSHIEHENDRFDQPNRKRNTKRNTSRIG